MGRAAAQALSHLSEEESHHRLLAQQGALQVLYGIVTESQDPDDHLLAAEALANIAETECVRAQVLGRIANGGAPCSR